MNYIVLPSLEDIALIKVAISLWNPDDIRASMRTPSSTSLSRVLVSDREIWWQLEMKVREKVPHLSLHIHLREKLDTFVRIIGLQILPWLEYHCALFFSIDVPNEFCWTPQGTIDCKKTAEVLIKDETMDITSRFILACVYCSHPDVLRLWDKVPENRRESFYCREDPIEVRQHKLVVLWTMIMKDDIFGIVGLFGIIGERAAAQGAFEYAVDESIKSAADFFLPILTPSQREESLVRSALRYASCNLDEIEFKLDIPTQCMDFLCYLLSLMNEQQQREVIESCTHSVLYCFIHWPRQPLLMEMAKRAWHILNEEEYDYLLNDIRNKMIHQYKDVNYRELFAECWRQSPDHLKEFIIDWQHDNDIISDLFRFGDIENIKLILESATETQKRNMIFSDYGKQLCRKFLLNRKWNFLKFYVREFIYSKNLMNKFKKEFLEYFTRENKESIDQYVQSKILQFCQIMNELIEENDRMSDDENDGIAGDENDGIAGDENEGMSGDENEGMSGDENEGMSGDENDGTSED